jgi:hypothetical protein
MRRIDRCKNCKYEVIQDDAFCVMSPIIAWNPHKQKHVFQGWNRCVTIVVAKKGICPFFVPKFKGYTDSTEGYNILSGKAREEE